MQLYIQIEGDALVSMQRIFTIQEMNTLNKTLYETSKKKNIKLTSTNNASFKDFTDQNNYL